MAKLSRNTVNKLWLAIAGIGVSLPSIVWADGDIRGRVSDKMQQVYFEGASIEIKELSLKDVSERDGSFRFNNIPAGNYTLEVRYLGAEPETYPIEVRDGESNFQDLKIGEELSTTENVLVYGQQAGMARALNRQRNADNIKSVVTSDSIGKFPDQNAAEALQRLPGVFISRDQGEGRFVGIRGIDPNLNNLTINGVSVPSPEAGVRSVAMDVIPSELIESLEVSKTVTADMDGDAVGGSIEIKSLSAFDRESDSYSVTVQAGYNEQTSDTNPKLSGSYTNIIALEGDARLGVAAAVSWLERDFGSHNVESGSGWSTFEFEDDATGDDIEVFATEELEQRHYIVTRERKGLALNLDYQSNENNAYYLRSLYTQYGDNEYRLGNIYAFESGTIDSTTVSASSADFFNAEMERETKDRFEEQKILSFVLGGENHLDNWDVEYFVSYSKSSEEEPDRLDTVFVGEDIDMGYRSSGEIPSMYQSAAGHDLSNFELDEAIVENNLSEDEELSFNLDITRHFTMQTYSGHFKFGGKYRQREKFNSADARVYDGGFELDGENVAGDSFETGAPDWSLGDFGPGLSESGLRRYFSQNINSLELNEIDSEIDSKGDSYESQEDILAVYALVNLDVQQWSIIAGLRYEATEASTEGHFVQLDVDDINETEELTVNPWTGSKDYSHLLPSVSARYEFSETLLFRTAISQTIARPSFETYAARVVVETETSEDDGEIEISREAEAGNPDLEVFESTNIDVSLEYYPGDIGVMSAGLFHKSIDNFVVLAEVQDNGQWDGFDEVIQPINGGSAELNGLELVWSKNFMSGFILGLNATFTDSDVELPNQAETTGNILLGYELNRISARLTMSHKSKTYQFDEDDKAVYQDAHSQVDLSVNYQLSDRINLYFNGVNLNDEPLYLYHGSSNYAYQYETYGSRYELGLTFSSF